MGEYAEGPHWEKVAALIAKAKASPELRETLRGGKPSEIARVLEEEAELSMSDISAVYKDLEDVFGAVAAGWFFMTPMGGRRPPFQMPPDLPGK